MGNIAGVFYFDSRPISRDDEAWVRKAMGQPGAMPAEVRQAPGLIASGETVSLEGSICCWDGVLHNRRELANRFDSESSAANAIAWKLYQTRGLAGLRDLIGDWSLAIWDAPQRTILLASDFAGVRPLYYWHNAHYVLWSSSLLHLSQRAEIHEFDEEYIADFIKRGRAALRTPYRGIYPVPPGQAVRVSADGYSTERFWSLPVDQEIRFKDASNYEEQLRSLFQEAVKVRLTEGGQVCAEMSGGLDSSSVASMASQIMGGSGKPITFSYLYAGSTDEKYIRAMERALGSPGIHLNLEDYPFFTPDQSGQGAPAMAEPRMAAVAERMAGIGSTVFLTGQLGDFIMGGTTDDSAQVLEYLERGRFIAGAREAFAWSRSMRVPVYSILKRSFRATFTSWIPSMDRSFETSGLSPYAGMDSLAPEFRKRLHPEEAERQQRLRWRKVRPSQRAKFSTLTGVLESRILQVPEPMQHLAFSHPFAHRPLVEYMMAIPAAEVCRPGEPRRLMRRAFAGILPPAILKRQSKTVYSPMFRRALMPVAAELIKRPDAIRLVQLGYVDRDSISDRLTRLLQGLDCNETQLRHILLLESWLRKRGGVARSGGGAAPASLTFAGPLLRS